METTSNNPNRPMLIFEFVCSNKRIGIADNTETIQQPTPSSRIRKIASDPVGQGDWVRGIARDLCPFNQIQRVSCRVKGYTYIIGKRADEGEMTTLYEGMTLV